MTTPAMVRKTSPVNGPAISMNDPDAPRSAQRMSHFTPAFIYPPRPGGIVVRATHTPPFLPPHPGAGTAGRRAPRTPRAPSPSTTSPDGEEQAGAERRHGAGRGPGAPTPSKLHGEGEGGPRDGRETGTRLASRPPIHSSPT